jgi:hypothetical protein
MRLTAGSVLITVTTHLRFPSAMTTIMTTSNTAPFTYDIAIVITAATNPTTSRLTIREFSVPAYPGSSTNPSQ